MDPAGEPSAAGRAESRISCPTEPPKTVSRRPSKSRCASPQLHGLVPRTNCFTDIPNKNNSTLLQALTGAEESCTALTSTVQPPFPCPFWLDVLFSPTYGTALSQCHLGRSSNQLNSVNSFSTQLENLWLHSFKSEEEIVCLKAYLILLNIASQCSRRHKTAFKVCPKQCQQNKLWKTKPIF